MKYLPATVLILVLLASLGFQIVRGLKRAVERAPPLRYLFEPDELQMDFARQRFRLHEFALASPPDRATMAAAEAKFRQIQQRYGQLHIEEPRAVAIVSIPEIMLREHRTYAWRIYVPPDQHVELVAHMENQGESPTSTLFVPNSFSQPLPAGESVIQFVWREPFFGKWGSVASADNPKQTGATVTINGDAFRWQSNCRASLMTVHSTNFPTQRALFSSEDSAELIRVTSLGVAAEQLQLVVRQSNPTAAE